MGRRHRTRFFSVPHSIAMLFLLCVAPAASRGGNTDAACITRAIDAGWRFRRAGDAEWHAARVPGCVHTDLLSNNLIEDPFYRDNESKYQWIERENWEYRTTVTLDAAFLERERIQILFEGLDTYAHVYINDSLVIEADNMFRTWMASCKDLLRTGENQIVVHFDSPVVVAQPSWEALPYELPGGPRVLTRKAAYHYGWDWGPRLVTSGIWRPVYLRAWNAGIIEEIRIERENLDAGEAALVARLGIESVREQGGTVAVWMRGGPRPLAGGMSGEPRPLAGTAVRLQPGRNEVAVPFSISEPKLWWTNGLGEPHLYELECVLTLEAGVTDRHSVRTGIRTVEIVYERDASGRSFFVRLNGMPVFMKGANYIPPDFFATRITPGRYESIVRSAREANMNMLRVWGGGIYESASFYDLCDENGILVWQDFMFACAMYPGDTAFVASVAEEAAENVKRLRNHPCIALWCGNNESNEGWHNWGWQAAYGLAADDSAAIWRDYVTVFHELLPGIVATHDPGRFYWPSSPLFGRADSRSLREGDAHYWGVWHDGEPFEAFIENTGRFMSEYGFQSFPAEATVESYTTPADRYLESTVMRAHQKHPRGNDIIRTYMERWYRVPAGFGNFLYASQILQADGMKIAIEAHRRAMPRCMGSLYWQLDDCWPVTSWSGIDYAGRWKALHYAVRRAFESVIVSPIIRDGVLSVFIVSDTVRRIPGMMYLALITFTGETLWEKAVDVMIAGNTSRCYYSTAIDDLPQGIDFCSAVLRVEAAAGDTILARNHLYLAPPGELQLPIPRISWSAEPAGHGYRIEVSADRLARGVFLNVEGVEHSFTENFFDLLPGDTIVANCRTDCTAEQFEQRLRIVSLVDAYSERGVMKK